MIRITYIVLLLIVAINKVNGREISEGNLTIRLLDGWQQLELGGGYNGVAAYCDSGVIELLIEHKPFDVQLRTSRVDQQIVTDRMEKKLTKFGDFSGSGIQKSGKNASGDVLTYILFFPEAPWDKVVFFVIFGSATEQRKKELFETLTSLRRLSPDSKKSEPDKPTKAR